MKKKAVIEVDISPFFEYASCFLYILDRLTSNCPEGNNHLSPSKNVEFIANILYLRSTHFPARLVNDDVLLPISGMLYSIVTAITMPHTALSNT